MSKFKTVLQIINEFRDNEGSAIQEGQKEYISKEDLYKAFSEVNSKWEDFGFIKKLIEELERN